MRFSAQSSRYLTDAVSAVHGTVGSNIFARLHLPCLVRFDFRVPPLFCLNRYLHWTRHNGVVWLVQVNAIYSSARAPDGSSCVCPVVLYDRLQLICSDSISCSSNMERTPAAGIQWSHGGVLPTPSCSAVRAWLFVYHFCSQQIWCAR